ncbi:hypothetical protein BDN72DRAFT_881178 [Pluteus cervinus]|uniref:Uncharacterized protein n=1 Tax=Pluteus cervinus TaxID=181527 RepID=A0ACD3AIF2_9AGAR|nr:hypothetical protein BDN72DRAFT_881178 [Pluteus cervinus]
MSSEKLDTVPIFSALPQELIDAFIDNLHNDQGSLLACTLSSRRFLPSCRKYLFHSLRLDRSNIQSNPSDFRQIFKGNPQLGSFVRDLTLHPKLPSTNSAALLWVLGHYLKNVFNLNIESLGTLNTDWNTIAPETRWEISRLLQLTTLTRLSITSFADIPVSIFEGVTGLKQIHLSRTSWSPAVISGPVPRPEVLSITFTGGSAKGAPIYTFLGRPSPPFLLDNIKELHFWITGNTDSRIKEVFLPRVRHLRAIKIHLHDTPLDLSIILPMCSPETTLDITLSCYLPTKSDPSEALLQTLGSLSPAPSRPIAITVQAIVSRSDEEDPLEGLDDLVFRLYKEGSLKTFELSYRFYTENKSTFESTLSHRMPKSSELEAFVITANGKAHEKHLLC